MEHWEAIRPGGYRFVWDDDLFRPGTDTFLLSSLPRLKAGMRVLDRNHTAKHPRDCTNRHFHKQKPST